MQVVTGHVQAYDWGPVDGLREWTAPTGAPQAELWFGTHPNGPSPLLDAGVATGSLPILMKLLAAARPLSIQIHPPAAVAAARFAAQQADPSVQRLVSDPFGKAEILIALAPFTILEGFRDPALTAEVFTRLGPDLQQVTRALAVGDLPTAVRSALGLPAEVVHRAAPALPDAFDASDIAAGAGPVMSEVCQAYPADAGVFVASMLNARTLQPGEAVYVDPGTVHAYVRGLGLEVMTSSDNVLRLGLTSKTIAVEEALRAVDLTAQPRACRPERTARVSRYAPAGAPVEVDLVERASVVVPSGHARIVLCLTGKTALGEVILRPGEAVLLDAEEAAAEISADGTAAVARDANAAAGTRG